MWRKAAFILVLVLMVGSTVSAGSKSDSLTFRLQSSYEYKVQIEFYSQDREFAWPGGDEAYNLDDSDVHEFPLTCQRGETICYGAWVTGNDDLYWGVGMNDQYTCKNCCFKCGAGKTPVLNLN